MLLALTPSLALVALGVVLMINSARRHRRSGNKGWLVLALVAVLAIVLAIASVFVFLARHGG